MDEATGFPVLPHWLAQPYIRPLPAEPEAAQPPRESEKSGVEVVVGACASVASVAGLLIVGACFLIECAVDDSASRGSKRAISEERPGSEAAGRTEGSAEPKRAKLAMEDTDSVVSSAVA